MGLHSCEGLRLRPGLFIVVILAGSGMLSVAAGAAPLELNRASFAGQIRDDGTEPRSFSFTAEEGILQSSSAGVGAFDDKSTVADAYPANGNDLPERSNADASFSTYVHRPHGGFGGGRPDRGDLGGDDHRRCEDGCVSTSAVPEPSRVGLMVAGAAVLLLLFKRRRAGAAVAVAAH